MTRYTCVLVVVLLLLCAHCVEASDWEYVYDAGTGLLPGAATPIWMQEGSLHPSVSNGVLHIQDSSATDYAKYGRDGWNIEAGVPVTVEARLRVMDYSDPLNRKWTTILSIQTKGNYELLSIYPTCITTMEYDGMHTFYADFTSYRTIRLATDPQSGRMYTWVDGELAFSFALRPGSGQNGISFGAGSAEGTSDSYWQYVAYSKEFLPVPEPSSLLAILTGLAGLGAVLRRRPQGRG